jgi:DNA-binding transcriptional regulator PaaX
MSIATTRNLTDSALAYLAARPGEKFGVQQMADFFGCHETTMRIALNKLVWKKEIRSERQRNAVFYWFEQVAKPTKTEPRRSPITHKVYALPAVMAERGRDLSEHRATFQSRHI